MKLNYNRIFSFAMVMALSLSSFTFTFAAPDEGMYAPNQIAGLRLAKRGLKIKPIDIYNPAGGGLTDAVIRLSVGCTAEFVSPEGLILTNHHCAFDALVKASTPENDLVETGFRTDNRAGEISAQGYSIYVTDRVEDVTATVRAGTDGLTGEALAAALKKNTDTLTVSEQAKAPAGSLIRIQMLNSGYYHYLYQTTQIKDVRVVYAPPRNIGVFGGDPDNFEWTRHTGDFTFLRAYTAPDGTSAEYSPNNIPMKPKKFLTMNIGGLKDNEFVFVLGYPGGTTRYRESQSIEYARDANFPFLWKWLDARANALRQIGDADEAKRIKFQSDVASFDNARKVFQGGEARIRRADLVQNRRAEEARFAAWIGGNAQRQQKYGTVLADLKALSAESNAASQRDVIIRRMPDPSTMTVFKQIFDAVTFTPDPAKPMTDEDRAKKLKEIEAAYGVREPIYELEMLKFYFHAFDELPANQKFAPAEKLFGTLKGKARRDAEAAFAETIVNGDFASPEKVAGLYGPRTMEINPEHEKIFDFVRGLDEERKASIARAAKFGGVIDHHRLLYQQGMAEMKGITPYPDANSTIRFSYGNVKGYSPREAEYRTPFTTLKGMLEKDTGVNPFDMPQKLKDLQAAKDFGRFGAGDSVVVNFISTNDIIGGNSGSPILNGNGEQVGLCFDGNYEGLGNDFYYDPDYNRTISVDIRFVLFVTEKFGNAGWILNEMKLVGGRKG